MPRGCWTSLILSTLFPSGPGHGARPTKPPHNASGCGPAPDRAEQVEARVRRPKGEGRRLGQARPRSSRFRSIVRVHAAGRSARGRRDNGAEAAGGEAGGMDSGLAGALGALMCARCGDGITRERMGVKGRGIRGAPDSLLNNAPGEGTGPTGHAGFGGVAVGRVPSRGAFGGFQQALMPQWPRFSLRQDQYELKSRSEPKFDHG